MGKKLSDILTPPTQHRFIAALRAVIYDPDLSFFCSILFFWSYERQEIIPLSVCTAFIIIRCAFVIWDGFEDITTELKTSG